MKEKELAVFLQVKSADRQELKEALNALLEEGSIEVTKRGRYRLPEVKRYTGTYRATAHEYGFLEVEGEKEDFYIRGGNSLNAFNGDIVEAELISEGSGKLKEVVVTSVIQRAVTSIVGTFDKSANRYGFVIADSGKSDRDIFIPLERSMGAADGQKVVCEILDYGTERKAPSGRITEILGFPEAPGVDVLSVIKGFELPTEFPEKVMRQADRIPETVSEADMLGRRDLRNELMVTIDSEDAKDLDDAVSLTEDAEGNYVLGVHIADVANYVQENSALDREALKRGTSVYLADRVLPMLPVRLSNGICSLNENVDRLAMSCIMTIDKEGEVIDHEIIESVIKTNRRMTYTAVNRVLENREAINLRLSGKEHASESDVQGEEASEEASALISEYGELVPMFLRMGELAHILREKRKKRGSIDFDMPETKIELDEDGRPVDIKPYDRNDATKLIEEFMLVANETVAEHYFWMRYPFVYRIHEDPDPEKMKKLAAFIKGFGYALHIRGDEIHPKEFQKLLAKCEDTEEESLINRLTLRAMQRAKYSPECVGHFGLACKYYCHFTSPIRRYPDLQIHRIIKDDIRGRLKEERQLHYDDILKGVCEQSSKRERLADEAEREVLKMKKAQYMSSRIGETYQGVISGITGFGMYVELENTVEGLVHVSKMEGFYVFDEERYELRREDGKKRFILGQSVSVKVSNVDMTSRTVDFVLDE